MLPPFCLKNFNKSNYSTTKNKNKEKKQEIRFGDRSHDEKKFRFWDRSHDEKKFVFGTHLDLSQLCKNLQEKTCPYLARLLKRGDGVSCKLVAAVVILIIGVAFYFVKGHVVYLG